MLLSLKGLSVKRLSGARRAWALILVSAIAVCAIGGAWTWMRARRLHDRTFRIGVNNSPPYYILHADGTFSGLAVDVIGEAARRRAISLQWVPGTSRDPDQALANGQLDMWPVLGYTPERAKRFHLTTPWIKNNFCVLSLAEHEITTAGEAWGFEVAHTAFPVATGMAKRYFRSSELLPKPQPADVILAVCRGEVAAGFMEARSMDPVLLTRPPGCERASFRIHFVKGAVSDAGIAATPEAARAADAIRSEISNLMADGTMSESMDKWDTFSAGESRSRAALQAVERRNVYTLFALAAAVIGAALLFWQFRVARKSKLLAEGARLLEVDRNRVLEKLATSESIGELLAGVSTLVERQYPGAICSLSIRESAVLKLVCSSRLPEGLSRSLAELEVNDLGSCAGPFAFSGSVTVSTDILRDARWQSRRGEVEASGLQACWYIPICSGSGLPLGLIGVFLKTNSAPRAEQVQVLESAAQLAAVVVERRQLVEQLEHQAKHDALTGLPNRVMLLDRLREAIVSSGRFQRQFAVLCIDLDRFKQINDTLGHGAGDQFLQTVSGQIRVSLRSSDTLARMGGDEFTILMAEIDSTEVAQTLAQRLIDAIRRPVMIEGVELFGSASIGIAIYPRHGITPEELQRNADNAMYHAKGEGKNRYKLFEWEMNRTSGENAGVERDLREALDNGHFELHYQPQFSNKRELIGAEALIRLRHPIRGLIPPGRFIPRAEETGLVVPMGAWVVQEVCRQIADWRRRGLRPVRVALNVSPQQLSHPDFSATVAMALARYNVAPEMIELEITETAVMRNVDESMRQLRNLRALGLRLAIDDFGTGYSSLSYLQRLPVNAVKIDQSFVRDAGPAGHALVQAIVAASRSLGLDVVAEGVETTGQYDSVCAAGCDIIQGFLLGRPVRPAELEGFLRAQIARTSDRTTVPSASPTTSVWAAGVRAR